MANAKKLFAMFVPAALAVLGGLAWSQPYVSGSDLWWHLASGRLIWETGAVPSGDPFTFTFAGREWMNHEWGWGALMWGLYRLEPQLVAWGNLALIGGILALVYAESRRQSGSRAAAVVAVWAVAATAHWFFDIRPHILTLGFLSLFLVTRDRPWARWCWAPLMAVWVNLHGGFVFGLGAIGLYALIESAGASLKARRLRLDRGLWFAVALAVLATLVNPWGYRIFEFPLHYLTSDSPYRTLREWQPTPFDFHLGVFAGRFWALFALCIPGAWLSLRRNPYAVVLALVAFCMACTSRRFIPLFAITAAPLVAVGAAAALRLAIRRLPRPEASRYVRWAGVAIGMLLTVGLWQNVRLRPDLLARWTLEDHNPRAALRYLSALSPGPRLLNYYNWGGYVMFHAPEFKITIDGRANTLFDDAAYLDYLKLLDGGWDAIDVVRALDADAALLPAWKTQMLRLLTSPQLGWRIVYLDQNAAVLLPPDSPALDNLPVPENIVGHEPQYLRQAAVEAFNAYDVDRGRQRLEESLTANPLCEDCYGDLARSYANSGNLNEASAWIDRGIAVMPRCREKLRSIEAGFLLRAGDLNGALKAAIQGIPTGPYSSMDWARNRIEHIRKRLEGK
jgi:hypothetical protein